MRLKKINFRRDLDKFLDEHAYWNTYRINF
jgi:hypothetical protein